MLWDISIQILHRLPAGGIQCTLHSAHQGSHALNLIVATKSVQAATKNVQNTQNAIAQQRMNILLHVSHFVCFLKTHLCTTTLLYFRNNSHTYTTGTGTMPSFKLEFCYSRTVIGLIWSLCKRVAIAVAIKPCTKPSRGLFYTRRCFLHEPTLQVGRNWLIHKQVTEWLDQLCRDCWPLETRHLTRTLREWLWPSRWRIPALANHSTR